MTTPAYVLRPQRRVHCTRCPCTCATDDPDRPTCQALVYVECGCPPRIDEGAWAAGQEFGGRGAEALHESATCSPAVPARCPRCKAENWLQPRAYVRGEGTSRATIFRRRKALAARRGGRKA